MSSFRAWLGLIAKDQNGVIPESIKNPTFPAVFRLITDLQIFKNESKRVMGNPIP